MSDPIALRPAYSADLVPMLTELLRAAKAGDLNQVAVAWIGTAPHAYGTWVSNREVEGSTLSLLGAVADLQHTILCLHNDQQD